MPSLANARLSVEKGEPVTTTIGVVLNDAGAMDVHSSAAKAVGVSRVRNMSRASSTLIVLFIVLFSFFFFIKRLSAI